MVLPPHSEKDVGRDICDRPACRVDLNIGDPGPIEDRVQLGCSSEVPGETLWVLTMPVAQAVREGAGMRSETNDVDRAVHGSLVSLNCGSVLDDACEHEPERACRTVV